MNVSDVLPQHFEWVKLPAGQVTLEAGGYLSEKTNLDVPAFAIAKYPVTNAQFQAFIDAPEGYTKSVWWDYSPDAKKWRKGNPQAQERAFPGDDHPRANVTWYEAVAFCRWLSAKTDGKIFLPTEQQWQRAAQALPNGRNSGFVYTWGNDWDVSRCNNKSNGLGTTTPVRVYEGKGDSPCGVVDMSGNVSEWCLTEMRRARMMLNRTSIHVLRGGSWRDDVTIGFRLDFRGWSYPDIRSNGVGFRLSCA